MSEHPTTHEEPCSGCGEPVPLTEEQEKELTFSRSYSHVALLCQQCRIDAIRNTLDEVAG